MTFRLRLPALTALGLGAAAAACSIVSSNVEPTARPDTLRDSANLVIVPSYRTLADRAVALRESLDAYCASPDPAGLETARDAFEDAQLAWSTTLPWGFGPLASERLEGEIAFWPTRPASIENNLASGSSIDEAWVASLGSTGKGLPVVEYLLFANDDTLTDARRCAYATAAAAYLATSTERLRDAWDPTFTEQFWSAGRGSTVYRSQLEAFSTMLTQMLSAVQRLKLAKLGTPLGITTGTPAPDGSELPYAHLSVPSMVATMEGLRALWLCEGGNGLSLWVRERDPELSTRMLTEIDEAIAALRAIPEPLADYVRAGDLSLGNTAYEAVRRVERTLASDVSGTLSISVMFTDNDGD